MARLSKHLTRSVGVALGALVATALPVGLADAATAPSGIVFYAPVEVGANAVNTDAQGSYVHLLLGAATDVTSIKVRFKVGAGAWSNTVLQLSDKDAGTFDYRWRNAPSGQQQVTLEATGYRNGVQAGDPVSESVTLDPAASAFTFIRPRTEDDGTKVPLGVFKRADGRLYARASGTTSGTVEPTAVDAAPGTVVPPASTVPAPTGTLDGEVYREPVDLSTHGTATLPTSAVIRVGDGASSDAIATALYPQAVTRVRSTTARLAGSTNVAVTATVTDQYGQAVVGVPVRLTGHASGVTAATAQLAVTDGGGQATFTNAGRGFTAGFYTAFADLNLDGRRGSREPSYESVVGTVSFAAPGKAFYHSDQRIKDAGGVLSDSLRGTRIAAAKGYRWIDNDGQIAYASKSQKRAGVARVAQPGHLVWVNAHGAPYNPKWLGKGRFETKAWGAIKKRRGLRNVEMTFKQNAAYGLSTEWEVKNIAPFTTQAALDAAFTNLATAAQRYYGASWRTRVQVKMLSNLTGGRAFALRVLKVAHQHGFTTILLARGGATRTQIPAAAHAYVTYVRGAAGGMYAPIPSAGQDAPLKYQEPPAR